MQAQPMSQLRCDGVMFRPSMLHQLRERLPEICHTGTPDGPGDAVRCGAVRCGAVRCGKVRGGAAGRGAARRGAARCGAVRCGAVRCGAVRCGAVRDRKSVV